MKRLLLMVLLFGCNGKHLVWVDDRQEEIVAPKIKTDLNGVFLSFDDGPDLVKTPKVLDILGHYNLQATFFVEGINLDGRSQQTIERRELLKRITDAGHVVGNHSYSHHAFCTLSPSRVAFEIDQTTKLIQNAASVHVDLIRLPYGRSCKFVSDMLKVRKLTPVYWDIDTQEWNRDRVTHLYKTKERVFEEFKHQFDHLRNELGQKKIILLMHDTKNVTVEALPLILDYLSKTQTNN